MSNISGKITEIEVAGVEPENRDIKVKRVSAHNRQPMSDERLEIILRYTTRIIMMLLIFGIFVLLMIFNVTMMFLIFAGFVFFVLIMLSLID